MHTVLLLQRGSLCLSAVVLELCRGGGVDGDVFQGCSLHVELCAERERAAPEHTACPPLRSDVCIAA